MRTLPHYDDLGLLRPAHVDPLTGYRHYTPDQVLRLHRILVLRDLGVPLSEVARLVDDDVTVEQLREILRLRQAEARARIAAQTDQLTRVEIRLAQLEERPMTAYEVIAKKLEPLRVVALSENLAGVDEIGKACGRMYPQLHAALAQHRVAFDGLSLALYQDTGDEGLPLRLTTALQIPGGVTIEGHGLTTIELAAVERAASFRQSWNPTAIHPRVPIRRHTADDADGMPQAYGLSGGFEAGRKPGVAAEEVAEGVGLLMPHFAAVDR